MTVTEHTKELYSAMGISPEVYDYGNVIAGQLRSDFNR